MSHDGLNEVLPFVCFLWQFSYLSPGLLLNDLHDRGLCVQANSEVSALLGRIPSAVGYQPTLATDLGTLQERITSTQKGSITSVQARTSLFLFHMLYSCAPTASDVGLQPCGIENIPGFAVG